MSRRLLFVLLCLLALAAAGLASVAVSRASFTTGSTSGVTASAASAADWVHLYSQGTDPDAADRAGYADQYGVTPATPCATGQDKGIAIDMGLLPRTLFGGTYTFTRVITLKAPAAFPQAGITSVTVTVNTTADAATGRQPLKNVGLAAIGGTGAATPVSLSPGQKLQLNLQVQIGAFWYWIYGNTYTPHITIAVTYSGGPPSYYIWDIPVLVRIA